MKEAIGSTVLLQVFLILFVLYIAFMAVVINYARTFQLKNQVTSIIEKYQGFNETKVAEYFDSAKINGSCELVSEISNTYRGSKCEVQSVPATGVNNGHYYQVVVFVEFDVPLINRKIYFPIGGETKTIYNIKIDEDTNRADYECTDSETGKQIECKSE